LKPFQSAPDLELSAVNVPTTSGRVFASPEDLWRDHLFEPLLRWVNDKLAPAVAIAPFEYGGITEARLVTSPEESAKATRTIALR
jgi:hypothetical protein